MCYVVYCGPHEYRILRNKNINLHLADQRQSAKHLEQLAHFYLSVVSMRSIQITQDFNREVK